MGRTSTGSRRRVTAGLTFTTLLVAACGSSAAPRAAAATLAPPSPGPRSSSPSPPRCPAAIKSSAPLQIATDATYQPNEYVDPSTGEVKGWDIDLAKAVCKVWGVTCTINNVTFADIIPALLESPSKYAMAWSSYSPTAPREAKGIDFVTYAQVGEAWVEHVGGATISQPSDMCGHNVAVEGGTTEESDAWGFMGQSPGGAAISGDVNHCKAAGKPDITVQSFATQTQADAALELGPVRLRLARRVGRVLRGQGQGGQAADRRPGLRHRPVRRGDGAQLRAPAGDRRTPSST